MCRACFRVWLRHSNQWNIWRIWVALPQNMNKTLLVIQCCGLPVLTFWHCYTLVFENAKTLYWLSEFHMGFWEKSAQVPEKLITNVRLMLYKPRDESMLHQHAQYCCVTSLFDFCFFFHVSGLITIITVMPAIINNTTLSYCHLWFLLIS